MTTDEHTECTDLSQANGGDDTQDTGDSQDQGDNGQQGNGQQDDTQQSSQDDFRHVAS
jgi:hypothetical protein